MTQLRTHTVYQGDTVVLGFLILEASGAPKNLATSTLKWALADPADIHAPILEKTLASGITITDTAGGHCIVTIPKGELTAAGAYVHELEVIDGAVSKTYGQGTLIVRPTIYPTT